MIANSLPMTQPSVSLDRRPLRRQTRPHHLLSASVTSAAQRDRARVQKNSSHHRLGYQVTWRAVPGWRAWGEPGHEAISWHQARSVRVTARQAAGGAARLLRCAWMRGKASGRCTGRCAASRCRAGWCRSSSAGLTWTGGRPPRTSAHPILIDPDFRIDPVLARFLARSRFAWLAEGTREACARDYRLFFSFLWQRGSECPGNAVGTGVGTGRGGRPDRRHRRGRARQGAAAPHRHHTAR